MIATIYLLKNRVRPEKKYHKTKNNMGLGASIPISEFDMLAAAISVDPDMSD